MENERLYEDFLEDNFSQESEKEFAKKLYEDAEFRDDFRIFLNIIITLKSNLDIFAPSKEETDAIFARVGILPAIAEVEGGKSAKKSKMEKIASITSGFLLGFLSIFLFAFPSSDNQGQSNMAGFGHQAINYCCPKQNLNTADQEGLAVEPKSFAAKSNPSNPYVDLLRNDVPEQISNIETSQNDVEELAKVEPIYPSSMAEFFNKINFKFYDNQHKFNKLAFQEQNNNVSFDESAIVFEFKNNQAAFFEETEVEPSYYNKFRNLDLSLFYKFDNNFQLGANYKQETFYLNYDGLDENGNDIRILQQPNFATYGIVFKYNPLLQFYNFEPIIQLSFGMNKNGFVTREMIGLEYYPIDYFYFSIGAELHQFYYQHNNNNFINQKISFNYGLGVKL